MARIYTVSFAAQAITAQVDLFELTPTDDKPIEIIGIDIGQSSDAGDAQDEMLSLQMIRGYTASGSGGASVTPAPLNPGDAAAGFAAEAYNTTLASTGTGVTLMATAWNVRAGYINWFPEDMRPGASQANTTIVLRMSAPADSLTVSATLYVREF